MPDHVAKAVKGARSGWGGVLLSLIFGGFGMVFVVFFFPWNFVSEIELGLGGNAISGDVLNVHQTSMSVNKTKVVDYEFGFTTADNVRHTALCYTTGWRWQPGASVAVRYLPRDPGVACIDGARLSEAGWAAAFVLIFPLMGFGLVGWTIRSRGRLGQLLRTGEVVEFDVTGVITTDMRINNQTVYKIMVAAPAFAGGQPVTIQRWT